MTLLSRFGGLARDVLVVRLFGATAIGSAFQAGFAIPNMFRRLFGEGALSAAFIPEYTRLTKDDPTVADRLATLTVGVLLLGAGLLTVLIELLLLGVLIFAPGDEQRRIAVQLIMVMLPFMPFICAAAILGGMLQVHGKFGPAASGPLLLNGFIIAVAAFHLFTGRAGDYSAAMVIGVATVLSGITQCLWFAKLLRGHVHWTRDFAGVREHAMRMARKFVPVLIGLGTLQFNAFLDTVIATWPVWVGPTILGIAYPLDVESNAILAMASRPYQFPQGVFGVAIATAIFPMLARFSRDDTAFLQTLKRGLRLSFYIGFPASVGILFVSRDIITVLFSGGATGVHASAIDRATLALDGFSFGIWAYSINHIFSRVFYAKGNTRTPMNISLAICGVNFLSNVVLIWPLREAGLAWSTSASAVLQALVMAVMIRRKLNFNAVDREVLAAFVRVLGMTAIMSVAVGATRWALHLDQVRGLLPGDYLHAVVSLAASIGVGGVSYLGATRLLRAPEFRWLLERRPASKEGVQAAME